MFEMFSDEYVRERDALSRQYEAEISFGRKAGLPEEKIKDLLVEIHGLTPIYAQNLLDCEPITRDDVVLAL